MNLSKIAVGVAVSLCLVSNVVIANTSDSLSSKIENNAKNIFSLEGKLQKKTDEIYDRDDIKSLAEKIISENIDEINKIRNSSSWNQEIAKEAEKILSKITKEQKESLLDAYGYQKALKFLKDRKDSVNDDDEQGLYYSLKFINDNLNIQKSEIKNFSDLVKENSSLIENNKKEIESSKKQTIENKENIKKNSEEIKGHNQAIANNKLSIKNTNVAINNLKSRLERLNKEMSRGFAAQSALTGLFQPYNVGKLNVSAALGGYKSENALAIGAGYRFNQNIAAKAGISSSLNNSDLSYNVGFNYEF
ncbi:adhesion A [Pasteurella canis]|uniref:Adhesion A n=1 Tax=Pasteurella canis TaxID=753 RepID=A0A379EUC5_9PAST|nr:YadA C-terminal domain-containing protein [Pasteurella canis]SUC09744.1 adhesion A [Pasteurella canis]